MTRRSAAVGSLCALGFLAASLPGRSHAVSQPDGTQIPQRTQEAGAGSLQRVFDLQNDPIHAINDAAVMPETFTPTCNLTFTLVSRGDAGFKNAFGWYNITGSRPAPSDLHVLIPCNEEPPFSVPLTIRGHPAYKGGKIGFFQVTPEGTGSNCAVVSNPGRVFYSERQYNPDNAGQPDSWVHLLIYDSKTFRRSFYFAWEDLFRGGDNNFADLVTRVDGITCASGGERCQISKPGICGEGTMQCRSGKLTCVSATTPSPEKCDGLDNDCNDRVDDLEGLCPGGQVCNRGRCVIRCSGEIGCPGGKGCNSDGFCVEPACRSVSCAEGQVCRGGSCAAPCDGVVCPRGQACRVGECVDACAGMACDPDQACVAGLCVARCECGGCPAGKTCQADGTCLAQACVGKSCPVDKVCADDGTCTDRCLGVKCPSEQECVRGSCVPQAPVATDAGKGAADAAGDPIRFPESDGGVTSDGGRGADARVVERPTVGDAGCGCGAAKGSFHLVALVAVAASVVRRRRRNLPRGLSGLVFLAIVAIPSNVHAEKCPPGEPTAISGRATLFEPNLSPPQVRGLGEVFVYAFQPGCSTPGTRYIAVSDPDGYFCIHGTTAGRWAVTSFEPFSFRPFVRILSCAPGACDVGEVRLDASMVRISDDYVGLGQGWWGGPFAQTLTLPQGSRSAVKVTFRSGAASTNDVDVFQGAGVAGTRVAHTGVSFPSGGGRGTAVFQPGEVAVTGAAPITVSLGGGCGPWRLGTNPHAGGEMYEVSGAAMRPIGGGTDMCLALDLDGPDGNLTSFLQLNDGHYVWSGGGVAQSFVARSAEISHASLVTGSPGGLRRIRALVSATSTGPAIGPVKETQGLEQQGVAFAWFPGEVPVTPGKTYWIRFEFPQGGHAVYVREKDPLGRAPYPSGQLLADGHSQAGAVGGRVLGPAASSGVVFAGCGVAPAADAGTTPADAAVARPDAGATPKDAGAMDAGAIERCADDSTCGGATLCELSAQRCVPVRPCPTWSCGDGETCRGAAGCAPSTRGEAIVTVLPGSPEPGTTVVLDAFHASGLTHVEMQLDGPDGSVPALWQGIVAPSFHWRWAATLSREGIYRATFRADPGGKVYGIGYFAARAKGSDGGVLGTDSGGEGRPVDAGARSDVDAEWIVPGSGEADASVSNPATQTPDAALGGCACASAGGGTGFAAALVFAGLISGLLALRGPWRGRRQV